jgi:succinate dehydrogenase flavin-adding protein (antitoxin of CptAB toxin-antitoxin module)
MNISQTEIASLVSQAGDEYLALLLVPDGDFNRIMVGRGISEIEAHEQLINALMDFSAKRLSASGSAKSAH